jgi:hypothetical protein
VQSFRSNKSLHLASVENPPIEAVQLVLEQRTRFLGFPDSRISFRKFFLVSTRFFGLFPDRSFRWRVRNGAPLPHVKGISFYGMLH